MDNNFNTNEVNDVAVAGDKKGMAIATMVCGIVSIVLGCCCGCFGFIPSVVAIVLFFVGKNGFSEDSAKKAKIGLICAIVGIVAGIISIILGSVTNVITPILTTYISY